MRQEKRMANVTLLNHRENRQEREADLRHRRIAIQIAAQLPEDAGEAIRVLRHAETLVRSFLGDSSAS
jgi:hypothetical protein